MTQDIEKNWYDTRLLRQATRYTGTVIVVALVVMLAVVGWSLLYTDDRCADASFAVCTDPARAILLFGPVLVLLIGGLGAFVRTYQVWKSGGKWPIWQGAGWALLLLMVVYAGVSAGVAR